METKLARIAEVARTKPNEVFTSLAHLINEEMLKQCHQEMAGKKAAGVDQVTKEEYEANLEDNVADLIIRMKKQAYKPLPVRRTYIPKAGSDKMRPLGIPAYEDKLVQSALSKILDAIYEQDFLAWSFGFRPGRGVHDALKTLEYILDRQPIYYIVDADIKGFFDHVDHEWLMKFLQHRITDPNILRLIVRILRAGVEEKSEYSPTAEGTPQGGTVSPILANVYLHYALDIWFEKAVRKHCRGKAYMVRYADDFVCCFQYEEDAQMFYRALLARLGKFNLQIAEDKTKIIRFSRHDDPDDPPKSGTFDFLGFTHYIGRSKKGKLRVKRKTSKKKFKASLLKCKEWVRDHRNLHIHELMDKLRKKLNGYYRFYGITDNGPMMDKFYDETRNIMFKWLNRRSQRKSFDWDKFLLFINKFPLPRPRVYVNIFELKHDLVADCK